MQCMGHPTPSTLSVGPSEAPETDVDVPACAFEQVIGLICSNNPAYVRELMPPPAYHVARLRDQRFVRMRSSFLDALSPRSSPR
jgi:hypothetical protein